jgi:chaperonin cofactor prefoldin
MKNGVPFVVPQGAAPAAQEERAMTPETTIPTETEKPADHHLDLVASKLTAHVEGLEKRIERVIAADGQKLAMAKQQLAPVIEQTIALKDEYENFLKRVGPALDRIKVLNKDVFRTFSGPAGQSNIPEDAARLLRQLTESVARLEISILAAGPERLKNKVEELLTRLDVMDRAGKG